MAGNCCSSWVSWLSKRCSKSEGYFLCHTYSSMNNIVDFNWLSDLPHCISQAHSSSLTLEVVAETHDWSRTSLSCLNCFILFVAPLNCTFVCSWVDAVLVLNKCIPVGCNQLVQFVVTQSTYTWSCSWYLYKLISNLLFEHIHKLQFVRQLATILLYITKCTFLNLLSVVIPVSPVQFTSFYYDNVHIPKHSFVCCFCLLVYTNLFKANIVVSSLTLCQLFTEYSHAVRLPHHK